MERRSVEPWVWHVVAGLLVVAVGLAFWVPGFHRAGGHAPVPLDDVYIHFAFARSAALGHPFAWVPGNGYSSGGTSLTWPLLLSPGWLLGLRGERLGIFAAVLTCACLFDLCRSLRALLVGAPRLAIWLAPFFVVCVPLLDWSLYSGMETALFAALLGRCLVAARRAMQAPAANRARVQLVAGAWGALLVATRPEAAAFVLPLGVAVTHAARSLGALASLARTAGPTLAFLALQAAVNRALTGEIGQAGAIRKLVGTNPYLGPVEAAIEVLKNLVALRAQAFDIALGGPPWSSAILLLCGLALASRRMRPLALPLGIGALGMLGLVALNTTARFQNFRYAAPTILMLLVAAALGMGEGIRRRLPAKVATLSLAACLVVAPLRQFPRQIEHFARASANIAGQQVEVARRLALRSSRPRRVFLNDAGAIPYLSGLPALDGLGLGGYHDLPFARASVHGIPAVLELIERLPADERPDVMAIYPSWWPELDRSFGRRVDVVHIEDNVICGAPEKVVYDADWSTLSPPGEARARAVDEVDVADLIEEKASSYVFPRPAGGWVIGAILRDTSGRAQFDGGRIVPQGRDESFVVKKHVPQGPATLALRTDGGGPMAIRVEVLRGEVVVASHEVELPTHDEAAWFEARVPLPDVAGGDRVRVVAMRSAWRSYHAWLLRP